MPALIDTDLFCELGIASLLPDAARVLGCSLANLARLPALPYMLRRGRLPATYGPEACARLLRVADEMPVAPDPRGPWFDRLAAIEGIDPGEVQLLAAAANGGLLVMTGDDRALRAARLVPGFPNAVSGHVVTRVGVLLALCNELGPTKVRIAASALVATNRSIRVCFSDANDDPRAGLTSYYRNAVEELSPLVLWDPFLAGGHL